MQSSGFAKPLVGAIVLLTMVATIGTLALPALAREASGAPFIEVQPANVEPDGAPSAVAFTAAAPTVPGQDDADDPDDDAADPDEPAPDEVDESPEDDLAPPTTAPPHDLTDIAPYPVPAGFEVLDTWLDGDIIRSTIYASVSADTNALISYLGADRGAWLGIDISDVQGIDPSRQWLYEQSDHPYCLWIEYYDKGLERADLEQATGLVGPQFLVVETPFCSAEVGPYA